MESIIPLAWEKGERAGACGPTDNRTEVGAVLENPTGEPHWRTPLRWLCGCHPTASLKGNTGPQLCTPQCPRRKWKEVQCAQEDHVQPEAGLERVSQKLGIFSLPPGPGPFSGSRRGQLQFPVIRLPQQTHDRPTHGGCGVHLGNKNKYRNRGSRCHPGATIRFPRER